MFTISGQKKLIATLIAIFVSLEKVFLCKERYFFEEFFNNLIFSNEHLRSKHPFQSN